MIKRMIIKNSLLKPKRTHSKINVETLTYTRLLNLNSSRIKFNKEKKLNYKLFSR